MEQYRPEEHTPSDVTRYHLEQNPELQRAYTQRKDEGSHQKQPTEEVIKWGCNASIGAFPLRG